MLVSLLGLAGSAFIAYEGGQIAAGLLGKYLGKAVAQKAGSLVVQKLLGIIKSRHHSLTPAERAEVAAIATEHGSPDARYLTEVALKEKSEGVVLHG